MNKRADGNWLEVVRDLYLESADCKTRDLSEAIDALESSPESNECRRRIHTLLHNLIGSGASYGFPSISVIARRLSSALKRAKDERTIRESGLIPLMRSGLTELREAFRRESETQQK